MLRRIALIVLIASLLACVSAFADNPQKIEKQTKLIDGARVERSITESPTTFSENPFLNSNSSTTDELDESGELIWEAFEPTGIFEPVSISNDGSLIAAISYLNNQRLIVYDGDDGTVVYEYPADEPLKAAVAGDGSMVALSSYQSLILFPNDSATPVWTYNTEGLTANQVAFSEDGSLIILAVTDATENSHVIAFSPDSNTPLWTADVDYAESSSWMGLDISEDGSYALATGRYQLYLFDTEDGSLLWQENAYNTEATARISGDGSVIITGSNSSGRVRVFAYDASAENYIELWYYSFSGGSSNWASSVAVSADGTTVAAGSLQFGGNPYNGYVAVFDTYSGNTPLWISETFEDMVKGIAISDDGLTVAAVSWGSQTGAVTDTRIFEKYNPEPFFTFEHNGSPTAIDMTGDGSRIVIGGKAVHSRLFGNGGHLAVFDADLEGGYVSGTVTLDGETDHSGVRVEAVNLNRFAITDANGNYTINNVPEGTWVIAAAKLGWTEVEVDDVAVVDGETTSGIDFTLSPVDAPPANLSAASGEMTFITLGWDSPEVMGLQRNPNETGWITGDIEYTDNLTSLSQAQGQLPDMNNNPGIDELDELLSFNIYRSTLSGGPYSLIDNVDATLTSYTDETNLFPTITYYYVVTAVYDNGESYYSNEVSANLDDSYLVYNPIVPASTSDVTFDGVLNPAEWDEAVRVDISDVFGYDSPDAPDNVFLLMKYDDENDLLLVACEDHLNESLDESEGIGFYVDDDDNDEWTRDRSGSEGNFWAYYSASGSTLRYRSLSGAPYNASPYYQFENPQLAFSDAAGYVTLEVALPMGFHELYEIALYGPDRTPGIGAFAISRENGAAIFNGWWPQDMLSITSNPYQFADVSIQAQLAVPPMPPENIALEQTTNGLQVNWDAPTMGIDGLPVQDIAGYRIMRNGEIYTSAEPTATSFDDILVEFGGYYNYQISGYIDDNGSDFDGPYSQPVGTYAFEEPEIETISYDDGSWESFYVVDFSWDGNKYAVLYDSPDPEMNVYTAELMVNNADAPLGIAVSEYIGVPSFPGGVIAGPFWITTPVTLEFFTVHIPGLEQPESGSNFYIELHWAEDSPGAPGIAMDVSGEVDNRTYWYTNTSAWNAVTNGDLMLRAGVAIAPDDVEEDANPGIVHEFNLGEAYPNPFNPSTAIPFELKNTGETQLTIYNVYGQEVRKLVSGTQKEGHHVAIWDGRDNSGSEIASGSYFVKLQSGQKTATSKIILLK